MLRSGCWCEEGTQPAPAPEISSCCSIQGNRGVAGMESTEGRAEWISTSLHHLSVQEMLPRVPSFREPVPPGSP